MDQTASTVAPDLERTTRAAGDGFTPRILDIKLNDLYLRSLTHWVRRSSVAVVLVDAAATPLFANEAATEIGARNDALQIGPQRLRALRASDDVVLQKLIAAAVEVSRGAPRSAAGAMRLTRAAGGRDYLLQVTRLDDVELGPGSKRAVACVAIWDPEGATGLDPALLHDLFGVTPAEIRLLQQLALGKNADQAAKALGTAVTTARYHLAHIYRKTQTKRLSELVRLLHQLAAAAPHGG